MLSVPYETQEPQKRRTTQLSLPVESELYKCEQEATKIVAIAEGTSGMVERSKELEWEHSRVKHIVGCADRDSRVCGWFRNTTDVDLDSCQSGTSIHACIDEESRWIGKTTALETIQMHWMGIVTYLAVGSMRVQLSIHQTPSERPPTHSMWALERVNYPKTRLLTRRNMSVIRRRQESEGGGTHQYCICRLWWET